MRSPHNRIVNKCSEKQHHKKKT